jgi:multiple sugar transport system ATP-binding protein
VATIECKELAKRYGATEVVSGFNLKVADNEFVVFLGPSGCGKSTILRMLAGLEEISAGELLIGGELVNDLDPGERGIAMVFQNYALYPHMSVADNIAFGLRRMKVPQGEIQRRVADVSAMLGLEKFLARRPNELSGGQQQRVAIARAMIKTPKVFLFDEPLSNLDAKLRHHMRVEIARLHQSLKTTTVYVTHDQHEAMTLADRIVLLKDGLIEQVGTPQEIFERPQSRFVAGFVGTPAMNFVNMAIHLRSGTTELISKHGTLQVASSRFLVNGRSEVAVGIRPVHLKICAENHPHSLRGVVDLVEYMGHEVMVSLDCAGTPVCAVVPVGQRPQVGQVLSLSVSEDHVHGFSLETGQSLLAPRAANSEPLQLYPARTNVA